MMRTAPRLLLACLAALLAHGALAAPPPAPPCSAPPGLVLPEHKLPELSHALVPGGHLDVLAIGSGSLLGQRGGQEGSVPDHMLETLRAELPGAAIRLTLHGARAATAEDMLVFLRRELAAHPYQLVLWQTGTVEAVSRRSPEQFRATLTEGVAATTAAGASLVLIDVPFSHVLENHADLQPYREAMLDVAAHSGIALFRRYELMRFWSKTGAIDLESAAKSERGELADHLRTCLGQALAQLVRAAAAP